MTIHKGNHDRACDANSGGVCTCGYSYPREGINMKPRIYRTALSPKIIIWVVSYCGYHTYHNSWRIALDFILDGKHKYYS